MNDIKTPRRPRDVPQKVGHTKYIAEAINLVRKSQKTLTLEEIARNLGATPALFNYYFHGDLLFLNESIEEILDSYRKQLSAQLSRHLSGDSIALYEGINTLCELFTNEGALINHYAGAEEFKGAEPVAIQGMKDDLAMTFKANLQGIGQQGEMYRRLTEAIWNIVCGTK